MNYEKALRNKYRFESAKGQLTVEQLWDLPLTSRTGPDLDTIARNINREIKQQAEESFVNPASNPRKAMLEDCFAIVLHIIATKQAENATALDATRRKQERDRLTEILHLRTQAELMTKTPAEIQAMIDALSEPQKVA